MESNDHIVNMTNLDHYTTGELRALIEQLNIALYTKLIKSKE